MAKATFHSLRGEKSALILVRANQWVFQATPVYVPKSACEGMVEGQEFDIPDGFKLVTMVDENGEARKTTSGEELKTLAY